MGKKNKSQSVLVFETWVVKSTTPGLIGKIPSVNREKIRDSWTICDIIGQQNDTLSG